jgi:uncharacterized protein involved in type VI secretion and phage assembly
VGKIQGVVTGQVVDRNDPEGQGRVKLSFPYLGGKSESYWAPISTPMAGGKTGIWFMPEIGTEVLAAFNQDDVAHPYVIGFLWNGLDVPPESDPKNRVILTPGGHTLRFEDSENSGKIILKSHGGRTITLDDSGSGAITVKSTSGQTITLDDAGSGSITLQGGGRILKMADGLVQIS